MIPLYYHWPPVFSPTSCGFLALFLPPQTSPISWKTFWDHTCIGMPTHRILTSSNVPNLQSIWLTRWTCWSWWTCNPPHCIPSEVFISLNKAIKHLTHLNLQECCATTLQTTCFSNEVRDADHRQDDQLQLQCWKFGLPVYWLKYSITEFLKIMTGTDRTNRKNEANLL